MENSFYVYDPYAMEQFGSPDRIPIMINAEIAHHNNARFYKLFPRLTNQPPLQHQPDLHTARKARIIRSPAQAPEVMITDYLTAHRLWAVPASVLYEEPNAKCMTQDDISIFPEIIADDMDPESADQETAVQQKTRRRGGRRHKGHFLRRPMATSEVIEELQDISLRENALRCLSGHLIERREQDPEFYRQAGFFLFHSCGTIAILLQEILVIYERFNAFDLNIRGSKRLANVLCLLQSVAANDETRLPLIKAGIPNYLIPFILSEDTEEIYENLRTISLSVIGILCQAREKEVIQWALQNDIIEVCFYALDIGSELSKVVSMTILDSILRVDEGLSAICEVTSSCDVLAKFIRLCADLVSVLAIIQGFSPRLLFLVVRCFILLCQNSRHNSEGALQTSPNVISHFVFPLRRALELLKDELPPQLEDTTFQDVKMEYPLFSFLRHQLLLNIGKAVYYLPSAPGSLKPSPASSINSTDGRVCCASHAGSSPFAKWKIETADAYATPMRPFNLSKQDWSPYHQD